MVDLVGFKKNADGSKGEKLPDLAIGENVEVVMEAGKFFEGFVESIEVRSVGWGRAGVKTWSSGQQEMLCLGSICVASYVGSMFAV